MLFGDFVVHVVRRVRKRKRERGQTWMQMLTGPDTILFHLQDLRDVIGSIKWFFGLGPRPHYGRYTYWEKFDYFAVFWGVMVIGSTGLVLWFPELLTRVLPGAGRSTSRRSSTATRRCSPSASSSPSTSSTRTSVPTSSRWTR